jgi:hypothetical protein
MLHLSDDDDDIVLYRGVSYSMAMSDLERSRLFFSQAISHNGTDESQEGETFRSQHEWSRLCHELRISEDDSTQPTHAGFIDKGDQYARSCYFISCWSHSESIAISRFAYNYSDKAVLSIKKSDLRRAFQESVLFWNSKQPGKWDMLNTDGSQNLDWDPSHIGYVAGPVRYVELDDQGSTLPLRLARAMRLPDWSNDEDEWRIALDLSSVPSSISTSALLEAELMPSSIGQLVHMAEDSHQDHADSAQDELKPMIEISTNNFPNYERGLWLNCCDLHAQDSFQIYKI